MSSDLAPRDGAGRSEQAVMAAYGQLMAKLVTEERFPRIAAAFPGGAAEEPDGPDQRLEFGLGILLDGVAELTRTA